MIQKWHHMTMSRNISLNHYKDENLSERQTQSFRDQTQASRLPQCRWYLRALPATGCSWSVHDLFMMCHTEIHERILRKTMENIKNWVCEVIHKKNICLFGDSHSKDKDIQSHITSAAFFSSAQLGIRRPATKEGGNCGRARRKMNSRAAHISWAHARTAALRSGNSSILPLWEKAWGITTKLACKSSAKEKFNSCSGGHSHDFPKQLCYSSICDMCIQNANTNSSTGTWHHHWIISPVWLLQHAHPSLLSLGSRNNSAPPGSLRHLSAPTAWAVSKPRVWLSKRAATFRSSFWFWEYPY